MAGSDGYSNPGEIFTALNGPLTDTADILRYTEFLRQESGVGDNPPIDLAGVFRRFGFPSRRRVSLLKGQAGFVWDADQGIIFINSDDPGTRQRFSEAHELMELLLLAQPKARTWDDPRLKLSMDKEELCESGAAELLMPLSTFQPLVHRWGISLEAGKDLARLYKVSLSAALKRAVYYGPGLHALVLWRLALKPADELALPDPRQLTLFADYTPEPPPKKLRVRWGCSTQGASFIPRHKSIENDNLIYRCYKEGATTSGQEHIDLGTVAGRCFCESMAVTVDTERHVLSVIHLPGDEHSALIDPPGVD
jgi:hypothetical protein